MSNFTFFVTAICIVCLVINVFVMRKAIHSGGNGASLMLSIIGYTFCFTHVVIETGVWAILWMVLSFLLGTAIYYNHMGTRPISKE